METSDARKRRAELAAQPPAPDPDETCSCGNSFDGDNLCMKSACQWEGIDRPTPAPPATTGPADEAEGLAAAIRAARLSNGRGVTQSDYERDLIARAVLASDWLAARDAAQQCIGAEKAWDEGWGAGNEYAEHVAVGSGEAHHYERAANPYRADRIAREGQA